MALPPRPQKTYAPEFQNRLSRIIAPEGGAEPTGDLGEEILGPNTRMLAQKLSTPENTHILDRDFSGYNVRGIYAPDGLRDVDREYYGDAFNNIGRTDMNMARGGINSDAAPTTVAHELLHRIQHQRPMRFEPEEERRLNDLLQLAGRSGGNRNTMSYVYGSAMNELLPTLISGFNQTVPERFFERFGMDRNTMLSDYNGEPMWRYMQREAADILESAVTRSMGSSDYEQASNRDAGARRGRGRPAYR